MTAAETVRTPFSWFGSKSRHRGFILPLLPEDCDHYVEPFGGAAAILLARRPAPLETYNDMYGEVVNFFKVLRDENLFREFVRAADLTPYSRSEFELSKDIPSDASEVERARLFFFRASVAYSGRSGTKHAYFTTTRKDLRRGIPDRVSRYLSAVDNLQDVAWRFKTVQVENRDGIDCIRAYDTPETLFYCDPPYPKQVRNSCNDYECEPLPVYHRTLAAVLNNIDGRAAISSYDSPLYNYLYDGWQKHVAHVNRNAENHAPRQEVVWTNYDVATGERLEIRPKVKQISLNEWGVSV